jgi:iron(III) transport system ATP-binding protein
VADVHLEVAPGAVCVLLGPSGSGKTTTLRALGGFEPLVKGRIHIGGEDVTARPPERRGAGFVFQDYALFAHLTVRENIGFGLPQRPPGARAKRIRAMLELAGLKALADRRPDTLSGGQQQRVALARALAPAPQVLLMDEPFGNLDAALRATVRARSLALLRSQKVTAVLVTHDQAEALAVADHLAVMRDGRIVQAGRPEALYDRPIDTFVASFLGETNLVRGDVSGDSASTPLGRAPLPEPAEAGERTLSIRPESVVVEAAADGGWVVEARAYHGPTVTLTLRRDTHEAVARVAARRAPKVGARAKLRIREAVPVADAPG